MASVPPEARTASARGSANPVVSGNALAVGSMVLWAAGFPAAEVLLETWHPVTLMLARLLTALALLLPLWLLVDGAEVIRRANWRKAFWIGFLGFGSGTNLILFAQWFTDPVTVALIATTTPIAAAAIEVYDRRRRIGRAFLLGLAATVLGGVIAVGDSPSAAFGIGVVMAVGSGICFAWASDRAVQELPALSALGRSAITFVGAAVFTAMVFALAWGLGWELGWGLTGAQTETARLLGISAQDWGLLAIYSLAAMALSQILFMASVGRLGIALTSFHINIAPFYVMIILVALGGAFDWRAALGAAVVGLGVLIAQRESQHGSRHVGCSKTV